MYIRNGEWVIISRFSFRKVRWKFLRSLRFRITVILVVIGIVPMIIVENGIVESYEERAVTVRSITVKNQCDIICDQMVQQNYLEDQSSTAINGEEAPEHFMCYLSPEGNRVMEVPYEPE